MVFAPAGRYGGREYVPAVALAANCEPGIFRACWTSDAIWVMRRPSAIVIETVGTLAGAVVSTVMAWSSVMPVVS